MGKIALPEVTDMFDGNSHIKINITERMRSQARTVAIIMDDESKRWALESETATMQGVFNRNQDYKTAFALLLRYALYVNEPLRLHNYELPDRPDGRDMSRSRLQFNDNMKMSIVEELARLIKEEADKLHVENPDFIAKDRYAPLIRNKDGDIPRNDVDDPRYTASIAGAPKWYNTGFALYVFRKEQALYDADKWESRGQG